ncbi:uncharacterized protein LOC126046415 [Accipiter gentilis]|uniref:uncharacterized protein LOC126046415 n=1 Tax=Astur gentilis TaxID=8957 RepID=UPI002110A744|nr:uncharacterized protein LOC126046415 [Accipiter gentilis]
MKKEEEEGGGRRRGGGGGEGRRKRGEEEEEEGEEEEERRRRRRRRKRRRRRGKKKKKEKKKKKKEEEEERGPVAPRPPRLSLFSLPARQCYVTLLASRRLLAGVAAPQSSPRALGLRCISTTRPNAPQAEVAVCVRRCDLPAFWVFPPTSSPADSIPWEVRAF